MNALPLIDPEFKSLIPPLSEEERNQLEQNILSAKKCRDAIILWEGIIIDGHTRYEICLEHSIEFEITEMYFPSKNEAKIWILNNQLGRRNLTEAMRIELALSMTELLREKAKKKQSAAGQATTGVGQLFSKSSGQLESGINTHEATAEIADISEGTLHNYMQLKKSGNQSLLSQVQAGNLKIGTARRMLPKELRKQFTTTDRKLKYISMNLPLEDNPQATQELYHRLEKLRQKLQNLLTKFKGDQHGQST